MVVWILVESETMPVILCAVSLYLSLPALQKVCMVSGLLTGGFLTVASLHPMNFPCCGGSGVLNCGLQCVWPTSKWVIDYIFISPM